MSVVTIKLSDFTPIGDLLKLEIDGVEVDKFLASEGWDCIVLDCMKRFGVDPDSHSTTYCCDDGRNYAQSWLSGGAKVRLGFKFMDGLWVG